MLRRNNNALFWREKNNVLKSTRPELFDKVEATINFFSLVQRYGEEKRVVMTRFFRFMHNYLVQNNRSLYRTGYSEL
jgi:hypothetical protein